MNPARQEAFRAAAISEGFDEVRFASADALSEFHAGRFEGWLDRGMHADMAWLERGREKRLDPEGVLSGVRSIVALGINYWPDESRATDQSVWAKYALYKDYHDTVESGLKRMGTTLESMFGVDRSDYRYYVDTGPIMERGVAARCGMGFQGKNGMLISRRHGNWLFLACLLTRIPFVPDPPLQGGTGEIDGVGRFCGTCRRCIDACPTDAIPEPGLVDARRCISYQTIENKGVIPRELRPLIGEKLFGCDICLDVCPWNRFARSGRRLLLESRYYLADLTLLDVLCLSRERFAELFRRSPVKRLKWRGLLRNACVVAGNATGLDDETRDALLDALERLVRCDEPLVRAHAVWAVRRLAGESAAGRLRNARAAESDPVVLREFTQAVPVLRNAD